jgi:hypothetical protein
MSFETEATVQSLALREYQSRDQEWAFEFRYRNNKRRRLPETGRGPSIRRGFTSSNAHAAFFFCHHFCHQLSDHASPNFRCNLTLLRRSRPRLNFRLPVHSNTLTDTRAQPASFGPVPVLRHACCLSHPLDIFHPLCSSPIYPLQSCRALA